jgi:hypothetical protein
MGCYSVQGKIFLRLFPPHFGVFTGKLGKIKFRQSVFLRVGIIVGKIISMTISHTVSTNSKHRFNEITLDQGVIQCGPELNTLEHCVLAVAMGPSLFLARRDWGEWQM